MAGDAAFFEVLARLLPIVVWLFLSPLHLYVHQNEHEVKLLDNGKDVCKLECLTIKGEILTRRLVILDGTQTFLTIFDKFANI